MASHRSDPGVLGFASLCPGIPLRVSQGSDPRISRFFPMASIDPTRYVPFQPTRDFPLLTDGKPPIRPGTSRSMPIRGFSVSSRWQATDLTRVFSASLHFAPGFPREFPRAPIRCFPVTSRWQATDQTRVFSVLLHFAPGLPREFPRARIRGFPVTSRWQATDQTRYVPFQPTRDFPLLTDGEHRSDPVRPVPCLPEDSPFLPDGKPPIRPGCSRLRFTLPRDSLASFPEL